MSIDPEVIPSSSKLGNEANNINPKDFRFIYFVIVSIFMIFIIKTIFSMILIGLGIWFIWKQATKKLTKSSNPNSLADNNNVSYE